VGFYVGIDPGLRGAVGVLDSYGELVEVHDMPVVDKWVTPALLRDLFVGLEADTDGEVEVVVEDVRSMPGQGVASVFKFGDSFGVARAVATCYATRVEYVTPRVWKADMRLTSDKELSRRRAIDRWPVHATRFARKLDEGRAEACLLAEWHRLRTPATP
jgi:crossover junction endodeoxyribonuclease RuvC